LTGKPGAFDEIEGWKKHPLLTITTTLQHVLLGPLLFMDVILFPKRAEKSALEYPYDNWAKNTFSHSFGMLAQLTFLRMYHMAEYSQQKSHLWKLVEDQLPYYEHFEEGGGVHTPLMLLISAEKLACKYYDGKNDDIASAALDAYSTSISSAKKAQNNWILGLACEHAADFCLVADFKDKATEYTKDAIQYYKIWGAKAKVKSLKKLNLK